MVGWLINAVYLSLLVAVSPILAWRMIIHGKYRTGWREKLFGRLPVSDDHERVIWLHAVSVGEVLQLRVLVRRIQGERPDFTVLITTTTHTGFAVAQETFPDCRIAYLPLDFTWAVRTALRRVRPSCVGLVELELWPNLIRETASAGIPLVLINGRISSRSYGGYRRIRFLMRPLLECFQELAVQSDDYAVRLHALGAPSQRVSVTGSIKFDGLQLKEESQQSAEIKSAFGIQDSEDVLVAGSTHEPEEAVVLEAWQQLRSEFPQLRLILVPRHQERFDTVADLIRTRGHSLVRRSQCKDLTPAIATEKSSDRPVCLLDTLGELSACWCLGNVAFVGGSLTRRGGQNMIEPAACGVPVVVGPNTSNFQQVVEGLAQVGGIRIVSRADELAAAIGDLLGNPLAAARQGTAARDFVLNQQGAVERTLSIVFRHLPQHRTQARKRIA